MFGKWRRGESLFYHTGKLPQNPLELLNRRTYLAGTLGGMSDDHLTNEALGQALGVTHATISRIRSGSRLPSGEVMSAIAKLMDWPIEEQMRLKLASTEDTPTYAEQFKEHEQFAAQKLRALAQTEESVTNRDE